MTERRRSVADIRRCKGKRPISMLSCYSAPMAALIDPLTDVILVGDSLGMTLLGESDTLGVSLDLMITCARAAVRATRRATVVCDLPFGTYERSPEQAFETAVRVLRETGCAAVKPEGGRAMAETVRFLTARGIPVMAHIGLQPQQVRALGGFVRAGDLDAIIADGVAVAEAGAFACVAECIPVAAAARLTAELPIPIIGIGVDHPCDGRVAVLDDVIGLSASPPPFIRPTGNAAETVREAVRRYTESLQPVSQE